jgi:hypothetical protein
MLIQIEKAKAWLDKNPTNRLEPNLDKLLPINLMQFRLRLQNSFGEG